MPIPFSSNRERLVNSDPLSEVIVLKTSRYLSPKVANYEYCGLTNVTPSTSHLNSNFKCVFD